MLTTHASIVRRVCVIFNTVVFTANVYEKIKFGYMNKTGCSFSLL